jgi:uncharacterized hydantoinase/oxoprolinase family protein
MVCADRTMLADADIDAIAVEVAGAQVQSILRAIRRVRERHPEITTAVVAGMGEFIASEAANLGALQVASLSFELSVAPQAAPAAAVALHLCSRMAGPR